MDDELLLRYSRQIFLPEVDMAGQEQLQNSHVVIMGVGGLGSLSSAYLAAAGVGKLTLVDDDVVDVTNLHRQLLYVENDIGELKVHAAKARLVAMSSMCEIHTVDRRLSLDELILLAKKADLVLDGTDNFSSRLLINQACQKASTPLLSAAVTQFSGQMSLFDFAEGTPCYQCLYSDVEGEDNNCAENGILGPAAGMMASLQALHALKFLLSLEVESLHRLLMLDMLKGNSKNIAIICDHNCKVCCF